MRKFISTVIGSVALLATMVSCFNDNSWGEYEELYTNNFNWMYEQLQRKDADGNPYYTQLVAEWDSSTVAFIHFLNDTSLTKNNNSPYYTSTIEVKYIGRLYDDTVFDSTATDSTFVTGLKDVIAGWQVAFTNMHVGDSAEILIPYQCAYGTSGSGSIPAYSNLKFNVKFVSIPALVVPAGS